LTGRTGRRAVVLLAAVATAPPLGSGALPAASAPSLRFAEVSEAWGIDFRHRHGGTGEFFMVETMGSGVAVFDYDGDGDPDVLFVDGGVLPGYQGDPPRTRLFRNDSVAGAPRFVDVTERAGIVVSGWGMGAVAADVDGDGHLDLYVTTFGQRNQLFRNRGDGTFEDVSTRSGVDESLWSASAAFGDLDGDGDLDLYVANYVDFDLDHNIVCGVRERGLRSYCHPNVYQPLPHRVYYNRGDGTFEDGSARAGIADLRGNGLGVVMSDLDRDGHLDIYVANDMTPNFQLQNRGDGTFDEVALLQGTALSHRGEPEAGMGVDAGDLDGDGWFDLLSTHLDQQTNAVYGNVGGGVFVDRRFASGLAEPSMPMVGFGVVFADLDHDGDTDVVVANGHIIHNVELYDRGTTFRQRNQVFANEGDGTFREVPDAGLDVVESSRGLAAGDLDLDGALDLVVNNSNARCEVYRNVGARGGFLEVSLRDQRTANRDGIGARIELWRGAQVAVRELRTGSSYLSQSSLPAHFGLGSDIRVARLSVRWPDGERLELRNQPANRRLLLVRPPAAEAP
jgi:enediyne biosynthesis protein E4